MATSEFSKDFSHEADKLKSDIDELRKDIAAMAQTLKDLGIAKSEEIFSRAEGAGERVRTRAAAAEDRLSREIEERPLATLLTAFGVGFVIGKLLDSGR